MNPSGNFPVLPAPSSNVTFTVYSTNTSEGTPSVASLTFTPQNYSTPQTVTVTGVDDAAPGADDGHVLYGIAFGLMQSSDSEYNGKSIPLVPLRNLDDDLKANGCVVPNSPYPEDGVGQEAWITNGDSDVGGNLSWHITIAGITAGTGMVSNPNGRMVWYEPLPNWYGNVNITYSITNEWGDVSSATSTLTVTNVPDKPVAVAESATVEEGGSVDILNVVGNDTDADNPPAGRSPSFGLSIDTVTWSPAHGQIIVINGGTGIRFWPSANWNSVRDGGVTNVRYKVRDPEGNVSDNEATIPITVTPKNAKPRANGTNQGAVVQPQEGELAYFSTVDDGGEGDEYANQQLTYNVVVQPANGTVARDEFGNWLFTPNPGAIDYNGPDSAQYTVTDDALAGPVAGLTSDPITVSFNILPVNDAPIAYGPPSAVTTNEDTSVNIQFTGADGDALPIGDQPLTFEIYDGPAHGQVTINATTGVANYIPDENYDGSDTFSVRVQDHDEVMDLSSEPVWVTVAITPVNDAPETSFLGVMVHPGMSLLLDLEGWHYDLDGDSPLTVIAVTQPQYATVTLNPDGTIAAEIPVDFPMGVADFWSYTVSDGHGGTTVGNPVFQRTGSLLASSAPPGTLPDAEGEVEAADLRPIIREARARWDEAGIGTSVLDTVQFQVADLDGLELARAAAGIVLIDRDAAGFGWFVDATPRDDREFRLRDGELVARRNSEAAGRMDLLTAVMHEMAHLLGADHSEEPNDLMFDTLGAGVRRNPDGEALLRARAGGAGAARRVRMFAVDNIFAELATGVGE